MNTRLTSIGTNRKESQSTRICVDRQMAVNLYIHLSGQMYLGGWSAGQVENWPAWLPRDCPATQLKLTAGILADITSEDWRRMDILTGWRLGAGIIGIWQIAVMLSIPVTHVTHV